MTISPAAQAFALAASDGAAGVLIGLQGQRAVNG
jgi:hypothetical protein